MGYKGTPYSSTTYYRRLKRATELGCSIDEIPDRRGKHGNHASSGDHYRWNESRIISSHGYVKIRVGRGHPLADPNGYAYEHTLVWCSAGNPVPKPGEVLHHENENKADNRIENLLLMKSGQHIIEKHLLRGADGRFVSKKTGREFRDRTWDEMPTQSGADTPSEEQPCPLCNGAGEYANVSLCNACGGAGVVD